MNIRTHGVLAGEKIMVFPRNATGKERLGFGMMEGWKDGKVEGTNARGVVDVTRI
jgi:hypothetical protein